MLLKNQNEINLIEVVERLDKIDILILRKFYFTNKEFPNDMQVYCFPILIKELKEIHNIKLTTDALRKRIEKLCKINLLEKVEKSNPAIYLPLESKKEMVENLIKMFISYSGLENFLRL